MLEFSTVLPIVVVAALGAAAYFFFIKKKKDDGAAGDLNDFNPDPIPVSNTPTTEEEADMSKFAFIVGINHYSTPGMDLAGCVNDANNVRNFLIECCGFAAENIKTVTDNNATKANILAGLRWLISKGAPGVELFYYHSGHGSQVFDASGDESDQLDEILVPHDHDWNDPLLDDYLEEIFKNLPAGAFLSMVCDTCHSGSMTKDIVKNIAMPKDMAEKMNGRAVKVRKFGMKKDISKAPQRHILLSGCRDDQTSSEAVIGGVKQGAMTYNFIKESRENAPVSWRKTHANIVEALKDEGWSQTPVLSGADDLLDRIVLGRSVGDICDARSLSKGTGKIKMGDEGIALVKYFETLALKSYLCPANVWTIGYGHTKGVSAGMVITEDEAEELLKEDMEEFEGWVNKLVNVSLDQSKFDALVSWTFNIGPTNLKSSTLLKRINSMDWDDVPYQIKRWNRGGGKILKGLVRRRSAEALLWEGKDWRDFEPK